MAKGVLGSRMQGIALASLMVMTAFLVVSSGTVSAETTVDGFDYSLINGGSEIEIIGYQGTATDVVIPGTIDGKPVTSIGGYAFAYSAITNVTISENVLSIGDSAFYDCDSMTSIKIAETVTTIGPNAFMGSDKIKSIFIPASVTSIGEFAFYPCAGLDHIDVATDNTNYSSVDGVLYDESRTTLIQCPNARAEGLVIPQGVTTIGNYSFSNCLHITSVTLPTGLTTISDYAFYSCGEIVFMTIPSSVSYIGQYAFQYSNSLGEMYFEGNAPSCNETWIAGAGPEIYYYQGATGFTSPNWYGRSCTELTVPSAPQNLEGTLNGEKVILNWDAPYAAGVSVITGYKMYRGEAANGWSEIGSTDQMSFQDDDVDVGSIYYYKVSATTADGEGTLSAPFVIEIGEPETVPVTGIVTNATGVGLAGLTVKLENDSSVKTDAQGHFTIMATTGGHTLTIKGDGIETKTMDITVISPGTDVGNITTTTSADDETSDGNDYIWIMLGVGLLAVGVVAAFLVMRMRKKKM